MIDIDVQMIQRKSKAVFIFFDTNFSQSLVIDVFKVFLILFRAIDIIYGIDNPSLYLERLTLLR